MNWYKKTLNKSIEQAEIWIQRYSQTHGGQECLIHGQCDEFAVDFTDYLNDPSAEIWSLWELWDDYNSKFPFVNPTNKILKSLGETLTLSDIGFEAHIVVKWKGFFWDGAGKQTIDQIMKNFDAIPNPHWFRL